ncbi:MAG: hypothetical protein NT154_08970, partial [Verrucomicrobia bacterium]|nr:hypothetical protein [Verrucomicrobiota bacterium]
MIERDFILETRTKLPTVSPADIHSQQAQTQGSCSSTCAAVKSLVAVPCSTGIEPFQVNRKGLNALFTSPRLVRRMEAAGWFEVIRAGKPGRETLYDYASV